MKLSKKILRDHQNMLKSYAETASHHTCHLTCCHWKFCKFCDSFRSHDYGCYYLVVQLMHILHADSMSAQVSEIQIGRDRFWIVCIFPMVV